MDSLVKGKQGVLSPGAKPPPPSSPRAMATVPKNAKNNARNQSRGGQRGPRPSGGGGGGGSRRNPRTEVVHMATVPGLGEVDVRELESMNDEELAAELELHAQMTHASKGKNKKLRTANHLLNFSFNESPAVAASPRRKRGNFEPYNKERYVQANFRFTVTDQGDYSKQLADADVPVDWDTVEEVIARMPAEDRAKCPICLEFPIAAKVTKCGHVYCWACVLRYLSLCEDGSYRPCPICFEPITVRTLKSFRMEDETPCAEGDVLAMTLMQRDKMSATALPKSIFSRVPQGVPLPAVHPFAHLVKCAVTGDIGPLLARERVELGDYEQLARSSGEPENLPFVTMANTLITQREEAWRQRREGAPSAAVVDTPPHTPLSASTSTLTATAPVFVPRATGAAAAAPAGPPGLGISPEREAAAVAAEAESNYFCYQAESGQQLFLHPLNVKLLFHEFGSWPQFPNNISGRVVEIEEHQQTPELRKRYKNLNHIPLSADLSFVELDMSGVLSPATIAHFNGEIQARVRQRAERVRAAKAARDEEERAAQRSAALMPRAPKYGAIEIDELARIQDASAMDFPVLSPSAKVESAAAKAAATGAPEPREAVEGDEEAPDAPVHAHGPTFADALANRIAPPPMAVTVIGTKGGKRKGKQLLFANNSQRTYS